MQYIDEIHCYLDDRGKPIPSVTSIVDVFFPLDESIPKEVLRVASERGTKIHAICEDIDKGLYPTYSDDLKPYIDAYIEACKELPKWESMEKAFVLDYAGRTDRETAIKVWDIKTQSAKDIKKWTLQMSLYCLATGKVLASIIWLKKTGKYEIIPIQVDYDLARSAIKMFNYVYRENWEKEKQAELNEYYLKQGF